MPSTYNLISKITVGSGGATDIEFTSIPATYTDLHLVYSIRDNLSQVSNNVLIKFNGVGNLIDEKAMLGTGSSILSLSNEDSVNLYNYVNSNSATNNTFGNGSFYVRDYAGSTFKSVSIDAVTENNGTSALQLLGGLLFKSTSAITSITLTSYNFGNFLQHSTARLYGIKNS